MSITFPTTIDTLVNPSSTDTLESPNHADQHSDINDAVEALETKVGVDSSVNMSSHDYKLAHLTIGDITDITASAAELNKMNGVTSSTEELNILNGVTTTHTELNQLDDVEVGGTATGDIVTVDDTQTLTNKTLGSPLFEGTWDGWMAANETWTYASSSTFTVSGDVTSKYQIGDKLKLTQTTVKYFRITAISYSSPNTTITVSGMVLYSLASATITNPFYSRIETPFGFPLRDKLLFSGTPAASITLSETSNNFAILDIWYEGNNVSGITGIPYYYTRFNTSIDDMLAMAVDWGGLDGAYKIRTSAGLITRSGTTLAITGSSTNYSTDTASTNAVTFSDVKFVPKITRVIGYRW